MGAFTKPGLRVLMADDSEEDRFFVQRALSASGVGTFFQGVSDGQEAIDYLEAKGPFANRKDYPFPNILLLDLKMPRLGGFDVLKWLDAHPECKVIPTIIFSSSGMESDVHRAYVLGANAYIEKPTSADDLTNLIQLTYKFWSRCQTPPPPPNERCC
jgi:two-component system response regulator